MEGDIARQATIEPLLSLTGARRAARTGSERRVYPGLECLMECLMERNMTPCGARIGLHG